MEINPVLDKIKKDPIYGSAEQDYLLLYTLSRVFQAKRIVEIGTHQGASAIALCQGAVDNGYTPKVWTVDSWRLGNQKERALSHFKEAKLEKYIEIIEGNSVEVVPSLMKKIGKIDLAFIDGDHSIEMVRQDYNNLKNYTNTILFHDTKHETISYWENRKLSEILDDDWSYITFPTRYLKIDDPTIKQDHLVGVSLARKK